MTGAAVVRAGVGVSRRRRRRMAAGLSQRAAFEDAGGGPEDDGEEDATSIATARGAASAMAHEAEGILPIPPGGFAAPLASSCRRGPKDAP